MSKHREALRRGIRSLIRETSLELADLEGREAPAEPPEPAQGAGGAPAALQDAADHRGEWSDVHSATGAPVAEAEERAVEHAVPSAGTDVDDRMMLDAEVLAVEVREVGPPRVASTPAPRRTDGGGGWRDGYAPSAAPAPAADASDGARVESAHAPEHREPTERDGRDDGPAAPRWGPRRREGTVDHPAEPVVELETPAPSEGAAQADLTATKSAPAPKVHRAAGAASAPGRERKAGEGPAGAKARARKARSRASAKKAAAARRRAPRERRRAGEQVALNGVDPRQVQSRKGVCSAYFMNHECWRVSDAYCNTALHVCAMRDCPVYHLHQEALERRFAAKYKHLW